MPEIGWTDAADLRAGDMLVLVNGEYVVIERIEHEILENPVTVYNFQVADYHTYHVGEQSILVHNANYDLLPGEGDIGTFRELIDAGKVGDNITPHHMPSSQYMSSYGISNKDGLCINMEMPSPGVGGRHRMTATYGNNMTSLEKSYYYSLSPRDALAFDINNLRQIYMSQGLYKEMRPKLQAFIKECIQRMPEIFGK